MLSKILNFLGGGIVNSVGGAVVSVKEAFSGNAAKRDEYAHKENISTMNQFAAEFRVQNRTWFDSLMDGLNRLPRPVIVMMVIYYFVTAVRAPVEFQIINTALDTIPERMWQIALAIVSFYFIAREFQKSRDKKLALNKADFDEHIRRVNELRTLQKPPLPEEQFEAEMADTSKPLSNEAIEEWNRRRKQGG